MQNYYFLSGLGQFLIGVLSVYGILLMIRILLSWVHISENKWTILLKKSTDPVLDFFTKQFPINLAGFNISIVIPFVIIGILSKLTSDFMVLQIPIDSPLLYLLGLLIWVVKYLYDFFAFIIISFLAIFLISRLVGVNATHPLLAFIKNLFAPIMLQLHKILKIRSRNAEVIYIVIIIVGVVIVSLIGDYILKWLFIIADSYSKQVHIQKDTIDAILERE